jgi:hypothetical protein
VLGSLVGCGGGGLHFYYIRFQQQVASGLFSSSPEVLAITVVGSSSYSTSPPFQSSQYSFTNVRFTFPPITFHRKKEQKSSSNINEIPVSHFGHHTWFYRCSYMK